jgi:tetratricopeptide (TPR) repeat protein
VFYSEKSVFYRNLKKLIPGVLLGVCCTAYAAGNNLIPALLEEGMKNYSEKKYSAAADYLGQVVDMDAEHSQARYYLVYSLALSGNQELALKHAEILAQKFPSDPQYKTLVTQIKSEITKQANNKKTNASNTKIQKEVILGGYKSLDKNAEMRKPKVDYTPRDIKPPRPLTPLEKAIKKIDEEEYDEAEAMLKDIVKNDDKNSEAYHNLGVIEMSRWKYKDAIKYFKKAAELNPKSFQTPFLIGDCYRNIGDNINAEKALKTANDIKYDEFALMNLAEIEIDLGKFKEAENIYTKILTKSPKFSEASVGLAQIRLGEGKLEEAMSMVNSALSAGNTGDANYVKALILYTSGMYSDALEQIEVALRNAPGNQKYILARAQINIDMLSYTKAMDDATAVLNKNPDSMAARLVIARALVLSAADDEAEAQLEEISKMGEPPEYYKLRGMIAKRKGFEEDAKKDYSKYFQLAGGTPSGAFDYAEFLDGIESEKDEAIAVYKAIVERFPGSIFAERSKEALQRLDSSDEPPVYTKSSSNSNDGNIQKACFSNMRVLQGALEMYNMDHEKNEMTSLDISTLVKEKYLKSSPSKPDPDCNYYSTGDLTKNGQIRCKIHGSIEESNNSNSNIRPGNMKY